MVTDSQKIDLLRRLLGAPDVDRRGLNAQFWCPFCRDRSQAKRKLAVRVADGLCHCWVCGWSARNVSILAGMLGRRELVAELRTTFGGSDVRVETTEEVSVSVELPSDFRLLGQELERDEPDEVALAAGRYLEERGTYEDVVWSMRLGISREGSWRDRILFPSFDREGSLNYLTGRAVDPRNPYRYFNPPYDRRRIVFNEVDVRWDRELVLVEGPFDLTACRGLNATCLLGSWMDERYLLFERLVLERTPVVIALDPEETHKREAMARRLMRYDVPVRFVGWEDGRDPCELGSKEFARLVREARPVDRMELCRARLDRALGSVPLLR